MAQPVIMHILMSECAGAPPLLLGLEDKAGVAVVRDREPAGLGKDAILPMAAVLPAGPAEVLKAVPEIQIVDPKIIAKTPDACQGHRPVVADQPVPFKLDFNHLILPGYQS